MTPEERKEYDAWRYRTHLLYTQAEVDALVERIVKAARYEVLSLGWSDDADQWGGRVEAAIRAAVKDTK